jgi:hypothetical protein
MGAVDTTYTFTATDTITSAKMNNIIDQTTITTDAIIGTTLDIASGKLKIRSSGITSNEMGSSSVTTNAIANGAVTPAKLSTSGPSWDIAGGTFLLSQRVLEVGYGITSNTDSVIDFHAVHPLTDHEARIIRASGANGTFSISNNGTGAITLSSSGGVTFGSANMPNPVGTAPLYGVRAWVNFDASRDSSGATNASNTNRFIRSSGNVTSVLKTATGKFTVTFTFAMPNTNYIVTSSAGLAGSPRFACADRTTATTTSIEIETDDVSGNVANFTENNVMVIA